MSNGVTASDLFNQHFGWTFDDINVMPTFNPGITKQDINLEIPFGGLQLKLPILSSPMDTVTESRTAIEMALRGGLGIIHMNLTVEEAVREVQRVKRYQMGIVTEPICRPPQAPISEVESVRAQYGFSTILITEDGTTAGRLLGMVTKGHVAFEDDKTSPLKDFMIDMQQLMTVPAREISSWSDARQYLRRHPAAHKLPLLNSDGSVAGFITRKDVEKMASCPNALVNQATGQLYVGAAISTHQKDDERECALLQAGVDLLVVDSAQGSTQHAVRRIEHIRGTTKYGQEVPVIAGNVVTPDQALPLIKAGAQGLRVGMGSGSICTTQTVVGTGRAQLSAIYHVAHAMQKMKLPVAVIADGGIRTSGDIIKALACGASAVMVGRLIAGCDETPAKVEMLQGRRYKRYRGMGSAAAIARGGQLRYGQDINPANVVAQGIEGLIPVEGPLGNFLDQLASAVRTALEYLGCSSIQELHERMRAGNIRFELRSQAARLEAQPHDIHQG